MASNRKKLPPKTLCNSDPITGERLQSGTARLVVSDFDYSRLPSDRDPIPRVLHRHVVERVDDSSHISPDRLGSPDMSGPFRHYVNAIKTKEEIQWTYWWRVPYVVDRLAAHAVPVGDLIPRGGWSLDGLDAVLAWMRGELIDTGHTPGWLERQQGAIKRYVRTYLLPHDMPMAARRGVTIA